MFEWGNCSFNILILLFYVDKNLKIIEFKVFGELSAYSLYFIDVNKNFLVALHMMNIQNTEFRLTLIIWFLVIISEFSVNYDPTFNYTLFSKLTDLSMQF